MANAAVAARFVLRSARTGASRLSGAAAKPKAASSPFRMNRLPSQNPPSLRFSRSRVEMSFVMESMLPYHSATASALFTSMLAVAPRTYGWVLQDCNDDV